MPLQRSPQLSDNNKSLSLSNLHEDDKEDYFQNINSRKRKLPDCDFDAFCEDMKNMYQESQANQNKKIDKLSSILETLTIQNAALVQSNTEIVKMLQESKHIQSELKTKVSILETECVNAHLKIESLEEQVDNLQRNQLKTVLEIRNVTKQENENLTQIVENLFLAVGIKPDKECVQEVYRRGKGNAPITVNFRRTEEKYAVLKAVKEYNKKNKEDRLNTVSLGLKSTKVPIYVSEQLTPKAKLVLSSAKELVKKGHFKYCWVNNGTVMLKKSDDETGLRINTLKQLVAPQPPSATSD